MKTSLSSLVLLAAFAAGCSHCPLCGGEWGAAERARLAAEEAAKAPRPRSVSGTVSCPERVTVLPNYVVRAKLANLRTGETVVAKEEAGFSGFPWFFTLEFDEKDLRKGENYGLVAEVLAGDAVLYRTDTQYRLPETGAAEGVDLVVTRSP